MIIYKITGFKPRLKVFSLLLNIVFCRQRKIPEEKGFSKKNGDIYRNLSQFGSFVSILNSISQKDIEISHIFSVYKA